MAESGNSRMLATDEFCQPQRVTGITDIYTFLIVYYSSKQYFKYFSTYLQREFVNWHCSVTEMSSLYTGKLFYCVQKY